MMSKAVIIEEFGNTFLMVEYDGGFAPGKIKLHDINKDLELIINAIRDYQGYLKILGDTGRRAGEIGAELREVFQKIK
jgi:hypothetical protein